MDISSVGRLAVLSNPDSRSIFHKKCFYFKTIPSGLSYIFSNCMQGKVLVCYENSVLFNEI